MIMNDNFTPPRAPRNLSQEKLEEAACNVFGELIDRVAMGAVVEGEWPSEMVERALLTGVVSLLLDRHGIKDAIRILEGEIGILQRCLVMPNEAGNQRGDGKLS